MPYKLFKHFYVYGYKIKNKKNIVDNEIEYVYTLMLML